MRLSVAYLLHRDAPVWLKCHAAPVRHGVACRICRTAPIYLTDNIIIKARQMLIPATIIIIGEAVVYN